MVPQLWLAGVPRPYSVVANLSLRSAVVMPENISSTVTPLQLDGASSSSSTTLNSILSVRTALPPITFYTRFVVASLSRSSLPTWLLPSVE